MLVHHGRLVTKRSTPTPISPKDCGPTAMVFGAGGFLKTCSRMIVGPKIRYHCVPNDRDATYGTGH